LSLPLANAQRHAGKLLLQVGQYIPGSVFCQLFLEGREQPRWSDVDVRNIVLTSIVFEDSV